MRVLPAVELRHSVAARDAAPSLGDVLFRGAPAACWEGFELCTLGKFLKLTFVPYKHTIN